MAFSGLLFFNSSSTNGTLPMDAALWMGYWPRLSFTLTDAGGLLARRVLVRSRLFFEVAKKIAVCLLLAFRLGGAYILTDLAVVICKIVSCDLFHG